MSWIRSSGPVEFNKAAYIGLSMCSKYVSGDYTKATVWFIKAESHGHFVRFA